MNGETEHHPLLQFLVLYYRGTRLVTTVILPDNKCQRFSKETERQAFLFVLWLLCNIHIDLYQETSSEGITAHRKLWLPPLRVMVRRFLILKVN